MDERSLTGKYLSGRVKIPVPKTRRTPTGRITVKDATENNLKGIDVDIPLGVLTCVTGVSGSGKSSLIIETLYKTLAQRLYHSTERAGACSGIKGLERIDKVIDIDQSPIGRTPRLTRLPTPACSHTLEICSARCRNRACVATSGPLQLQRQGRALRGMPGRRRDKDRDALPA